MHCVAQHATKSLVCMWFTTYSFLQPVVNRNFLFPMRIKSCSRVTFYVSLCIENRTIKILQRIQSKSCFVQVLSDARCIKSISISITTIYYSCTLTYLFMIKMTMSYLSSSHTGSANQQLTLDVPIDS